MHHFRLLKLLDKPELLASDNVFSLCISMLVILFLTSQWELAYLINPRLYLPVTIELKNEILRSVAWNCTHTTKAETAR